MRVEFDLTPDQAVLLKQMTLQFCVGAKMLRFYVRNDDDCRDLLLAVLRLDNALTDVLGINRPRTG